MMSDVRGSDHAPVEVVIWDARKEIMLYEVGTITGE